MRRIITSFLLLVCSFSLMSFEAHAARFGGGRSFGVQRSHHSLYTNHAQKNKTYQNTQASNPNKSRLGSMIGGMLIGGLLTSLFMGHGFGTGFFSWLLVGLFVMMLLSLKRKWSPAMAHQAFSQRPFSFTNGSPFASSSNASTLNFDEPSFLRQAQVYFIRLQAAYDQKNEQDLSTFLSPDLYAEIKMQMTERGSNPNKTEVLSLNATLLNVSEQFGALLVSVMFSGQLKENGNSPIDFEEIWHFRQNRNEPFTVVGIQQASIEAA